MVRAATTDLHPLLWAVIAMNAPVSNALVSSILKGNQDAQRVATRHQVGRALTLHLLKQAEPCPWCIKTIEGGKPIAVGGGLERHISVSHTGSFVAAAVSTIGPVGIDIERQNRARDVVAAGDGGSGLWTNGGGSCSGRGVCSFLSYLDPTRGDQQSDWKGPGVSRRPDRPDPYWNNKGWNVGGWPRQLANRPRNPR